MNLRSALSVLAKSSPYAVRTLTERVDERYAALKEWLFVQQPIETDFLCRLDALGPGEVVFLCGSSGDGKSEILIRCHEAYSARFRFHLDATHSFSPRQSAIQALDELFDEVSVSRQPLVLGINVGMLANYAKEGAERHAGVRAAADLFLEGKPVEPPYYFLDFEKYPKFEFADGPAAHSPFVKELMRRLTSPDTENPFRQAAAADERAGLSPQLLANYRLLGVDAVQDAIIGYLFKARLSKEQFITARTLLDFLHHLLMTNAPLADNIFGGGGNDLVQRLADFDPALDHSKALDEFVLLRHLGVADAELEAFLSALAAEGLIHKEQTDRTPFTLLRLFSLLVRAEIGNGYHRRFGLERRDELLAQYASVWSLHTNFDGTVPSKAELRRSFYGKLAEAIFRYANRNAPKIGPGEIYLGERGPVILAGAVDLKPDFVGIQAKGGREATASRFFAHLQVGDQKLDPIPINLNLFELIDALYRGYRPNRHDKNSIVFLDDLTERIVAHANRGKALKLYEGALTYTIRQEDDMIEAVGPA